MPRRVGTLAAAMVVGIFTGCGGEGPALGELTQEEAALLLGALSAAYLPTPTPPAATAALPGGAALAPTTTVRTDSTQATFPCAAGGSVLVTTADSTEITVDVVLNPHPDTTFVSNTTYVGSTRATTSYLGCTSRDFQGGAWTLDADPGLTFAYDIAGTTFGAGLTSGGTTTMSSYTLDGTWSGTLGWSHSGRSGSCSIAVVTEMTNEFSNGVSSYDYSQSGQVCGLAVSTTSSTNPG